MTDGGFGQAAARLSSAASMLLGWRPDEFWNATPAELAAAIGGDDAAAAPTRDEMEALQQRFPDEQKD